ncbi:MAG TPA: HAD-IIIC family phosphatase [Polyangiaceae bacterium]|nr:HAD-IIIC family phosphatase [Polyangiaceae bacterium]
MNAEFVPQPTATSGAELLRYPFDGRLILRYAKRLKREGLARENLLPLRIAILGGWTSQETASLLELFLLSLGIRAEIYQSEYEKYYEDAVLDTASLEQFQPQVVYLHTGVVNLRELPRQRATEADFELSLRTEIARFEEIWESLQTKLRCTVVQNNFELPLDVLGNFGGTAYSGRRHFVQRLNLAFADRARSSKNLIIHDICALSARLGTDRWFDPLRYHAYKLLVAPDANAALAHSLASVVAAAFGRAKKCLVLDLDNTLWGGVIGDDGVDKIRIGRETAEAEAFTAFQQHALDLHQRGVLLAVCSKNDEVTAKLGFSHPDSILRLEHVSAFRANWEPKPQNIVSIAEELNIGLDSLVFVDDNPAERELVRAQLPMVAVPEVGADVTRYPEILAASGYFETVGLSAEDLNRSKLYEANSERSQMAAKYASYDEYLAALEMHAEIAAFSGTYLDRITQLINKTNQFNLTTRRYTSAEVEAAAQDPGVITLYGRLADRFGDNGLISIIIGRHEAGTVHVDLWLMSCRVLKRNMEHAMLDALVEHSLERGASRILGSYIRTQKNGMVADHYERLGFSPMGSEPDGARSEWTLAIDRRYDRKNRHISVSGAAK